MTDYSEEQRNELEALESIYPDSFTGAGPRRGRAGSRRAAGGAGGRGGAAARPAGVPGGAARVGARDVGSLSPGGKSKALDGPCGPGRGHCPCRVRRPGTAASPAWASRSPALEGCSSEKPFQRCSPGNWFVCRAVFLSASKLVAVVRHGMFWGA